MFETGKIPPEILERIVIDPIRECGTKRADVILRPKTGEDCCGIDTQGELCLLSTDPITGASKELGYLAIQINCNDIYSSGGEPVGILLTILLPESSTEEMLDEIMQGALRGANERGIEILGGHTEVTDAVNRPIVSATVIGKTSGRVILSTGGARVGQDVIMTKWAGLEGTAILAKDLEKELAEILPEGLVLHAQDMYDSLSVEKESRIAKAYGATAMHDATEGGILGAVWEMADCAELGIEVYGEKILVKEETKEICRVTGIDYLRLISSGSMIIATENGAGLVQALEEAGVPSAVIGKMVPEGRTLQLAKGVVPLDEPRRDELYGAKVQA